jgi:pectin methylesterase-like acyl-CoA thioesterase
MIRRLTATLFATALSASSLAAAACPGGARWCDDFESGTARWQAVSGSATNAGEAGKRNHLLLLDGAGGPALLASREAVAPVTAYFVEARMRPAGGAAAQAYVLARYVDDRTWVGAGIEATPGSPRVSVSIVKMQDGKLTRLKQWGKEAGPEGGFYTVRLDSVGDVLTLYLNGERLTTATDAPLPTSRIGLLAQGGAAQFDDVRLGATGTSPARIGFARLNNRISLQAGDAPQRYLVSAAGATLPVAASSSDPSVATAAIEGDALVVTPRRAGRATIGVTSLGDPNVATWLGVDVGPAFAGAARAYALEGRASPAAGASGVQVDTLLRMRFDRPVALGASGSVRIFRAADDALVDVIRVGDELDAIGYGQQEFKRVVRHKLIETDGDSVTIHPHSARLAYDSAYYVLVDAGVFKDATIGGEPFAGLGDRAGWRFRTRPAPPAGRMLTVDDDGPADFRTVQGALNHAMQNVPRSEPVTIHVANGRYDELLYLRGKDNVTLRGESRDGVVIGTTNDDGTNAGSGSGQSASMPGASGGRSVFLVEDADLLTLDTLTVVNTALRATSLGAQAEALNFNSDRGRFVAHNASFLSEQDTIQVKGYSWFYRTLVAGNVDFIWGGNHAALFEESEIRSVGDSANPGRGGYIVQARTVGRDDPGFVFLNSRLTHGPGPAHNDIPPGVMYLARPGTPDSWDKVSYINCRMHVHIAPVGWSLPRQAHARAGADWSEYGSMDMAGAPLDLSGRLGGHVLTAAQVAARFSSRAQVFAGFDGGKGWNPTPPDGR